MIYPTEDSWGHVRTQKACDALKAALELINSSETIGAVEESANHHSESDFRKEMAADLHVAQVEDWKVAPWSENYEVAYCRVCGGELERERSR